MTRFHWDIIDERKQAADAMDRARLRKTKKYGGGVPPENKLRAAVRASVTMRKKIPITLPTVNFGRARIPEIEE